MNKPKYRIDQEFDVSFTVRVKGRTQGDGEVYTMTGHIAHDLMEEFGKSLVKAQKGVSSVNVSIEINNLEEKKKTK